MPYLIVSVLIHVALLYLLKFGGSGGGEGEEGGSQENSVRVKLLDKVTDTESSKPEQEVPDEDGIVIKKELPPEQVLVEHKCDEFYTGIGIQHGPHCVIDYIAKGYPADRAGLRVGDRTEQLRSGECQGRGPEGSFLELRITRGDRTFTVKLVREKICTSPEE